MTQYGNNFSKLSHEVIGCAIEVHRNLGAGLLESTYEACLAKEFIDKGIIFQQQKELPVIYKGNKIDCGYRLDLLVNNQIIIELKSVEKLLPIHEAQILTYMKLSNIRQGLLINFNVKYLKEGIKSFIL